MMSRLLRANFMRLVKNKPFYICIAVMAFCGIYLPVTDYSKMIKSGTVCIPDKNFLRSACVWALWRRFYKYVHRHGVQLRHNA